MKYLKPLCILLGLLITAWAFYQPQTRSALLAAASWAESEPLLAAPLFLVFLIVAVVLMFPVWMVLMVGGYLFGPIYGIILAWFAYQIGAALAFLFARTIGRGWVTKSFSKHEKFNKLESRLNRSGFTAILLARLSFIFPTNILNLLAGVSAITTRNFILATAIGSVPMVLVYTYLGSRSSNLIESISDGSFKAPALSPPIIICIVGLLLMVAVVALYRIKQRPKP